MTVYLDVLFIINVGMDFLMLTLLSNIFGYQGNIRRRILASILGGGLACISFIIWPYQRGIGQIVLSCFISGIMLLVAYGSYDLRSLCKRFFCLYLIVYGFGGVLTWILKETKGGYYFILLMKTTSIRNLYFKSFLFISVGVFLLLFLLFSTGKGVREEQQFLYPVSLMIGKKTIHTIGFLDTGNRLREPVTKKAVLVIEFHSVYAALNTSLATWLERYFERSQDEKKKIEVEEKVPEEIYWIPFSSVGKKAGQLPAILCDSVFLDKKPVIEEKEVYLAITNQRLSPTREYFLLLHTDLWKETKNKK